MKVNGQAYDKPADSFFFGQRLEIVAGEVGRSSRVIGEWTRDARLGIRQSDTDSDCPVVDAGDSHIFGGHRALCIRMAQPVAGFPPIQNVRVRKIESRTRARVCRS